MILIDSLTPTEQRMYKVLADNQRHTRKEIISCLGEQNGNCLSVHLHQLRVKLRAVGYTVVTITIDGQLFYELGRSLTSPYDGRS